MKTLFRVALVTLFVFLPVNKINAYRYDYANINIFSGNKSMNDNNFRSNGAELEKQAAYGLDLSLNIPQIGLGLALGYTHSSASDDITVQSENGSGVLNQSIDLQELTVGLRQHFRYRKLFFLMGGGLAHVKSKHALKTKSGDTTAFDSRLSNAVAIGYYLEGGILYKIAKPFTIGAKWRFSAATDFSIGSNLDVDYGATLLAVYLGVAI